MKRLIVQIRRLADYCITEVWHDTRKTPMVKFVKTCNLAVRSFLDHGLQLRAAALTYSTVLAIVPIFALLFAIGRGFGFQKLLESEIYTYFPSQTTAISTALGFVDSYLEQSGQGVFVGVGIVVLLWTLVSLLSSIEDAFNNVWDITKSRSLYQKITDYFAICLIVPVLMICSAGATIFVSTLVQNNLNLPFFTPLVNTMLDLSPLVFAWLAFSLSYYLIPNTKVNFKYAAISGAIASIAFAVVQALFVNGQIYVTKFNAIYGSFAFLPLLLVWLQLSWLILLAGCVVTYSMQNVFNYNYTGNSGKVSRNYMRKIITVAMAVITRRFVEKKRPLTINEISTRYDLPISLLRKLDNLTTEAGLVYHVTENQDRIGIVPAFETEHFTVKDLFKAIDTTGSSGFIPGFEERYPEVCILVDSWSRNAWNDADVRLRDIDVDLLKSSEREETKQTAKKADKNAKI